MRTLPFCPPLSLPVGNPGVPCRPQTGACLRGVSAMAGPPNGRSSVMPLKSEGADAPSTVSPAAGSRQTLAGSRADMEPHLDRGCRRTFRVMPPPTRRDRGGRRT